jgi:hypothetical protein
MGGSKPKAPDMSKQNALLDAQRKDLEEQRAKAAKREAEEEAKRKDLEDRRRRGRTSLLGTEGDELGVL